MTDESLAEVRKHVEQLVRNLSAKIKAISKAPFDHPLKQMMGAGTTKSWQ